LQRALEGVDRDVVERDHAAIEVAGQIERAYPGYHVWTSSEGHWYASRTSASATGPSPTVDGDSPDELTTALAAEQDAAAKAHQAALTAPVVMSEPPPVPAGWSGATTPSCRMRGLIVE